MVLVAPTFAHHNTQGQVYHGIPDGKILHELRLLQGAMKDAREIDKTVPVVRSALLRRPSRAKAKPAAEPEVKVEPGPQ